MIENDCYCSMVEMTAIAESTEAVIFLFFDLVRCRVDMSVLTFGHTFKSSTIALPLRWVVFILLDDFGELTRCHIFRPTAVNCQCVGLHL